MKRKKIKFRPVGKCSSSITGGIIPEPPKILGRKTRRILDEAVEKELNQGKKDKKN